MNFNPDKVSFGRHETFPLRYSWLSKGYQAVAANPFIFAAPDATVTLGVGKNMVNSIRYWLQATRMIQPTTNGFLPSILGKTIFDEKSGVDPYLEDEGTIWLLHWLLATNAEQATAWYWFFNKFHKPEFKGQEVISALSDFVAQKVQVKVAATTIKNDVSIILRMYARSNVDAHTPIEEALDSPLTLLHLIRQNRSGRAYSSNLSAQEGLPIAILGFAMAELFEQLQSDAIPLGELMYAKEETPALGAVFRLTENALISKLETFVRQHPSIFEIRETAGIHQVYRLRKVDPVSMLAFHYDQPTRGAA